jgi:adenylate cyclase
MGAEQVETPVIAWLLREAKALDGLDAVVDALCARLNAAGVPVDRAIVSTNTLHAVHLSYFRLWRSDGAHVSDTYDRDEVHLGYFDRSPLRVIIETGQPVELVLADTPDEAFGIVPDLKRDGFTHYLCVPLPFSDGANNQLSWATKHPGGFTPAQIAALRALEPALAATLEIRMLRRALVETLQTYLGDEPGRRVADGAIVRGEVGEIEAAILFADLRGFTAHAMTLENGVLVELLNAYFACLIPAVEAHGGDVLKLIGDGMLAIFPDAAGDAPRRALAAAREAQAAMAAANARGSAWPALAAGIALHHGTAAYGNIGSQRRLDFTVIGRDVNIASRICGVCREAGAPVLMSDAFRRRLGAAGEAVGAFALHGIAEPMTLYRPEGD